MRKLGVSYNAFDGVELLPGAIRSLGVVVDYVCVVYQTVSNFGDPLPRQDLRLLELYRRDNPHVQFVEYRPPSMGGHANELAKRNIGLRLCADAGCTHFMTADVDEYYVPEQLDAAFTRVVDDGFDSSACQMQTYWKTPDFVLWPPETYYVPLIYKLDHRRFDMSHRWSVSADPTRRLNPGRLLLFDRPSIEMHHLTAVRRDYKLKLTNSSARVNFAGRIDELARLHAEWSPGDRALMPGREERWYDVWPAEIKIDIKHGYEEQ